MHSQYLAQGWEEIKQMKAELWIYFQDADQQLQNLKRRRAELELNIAQNMVLQVKVRMLWVKNRTKKFILQLIKIVKNALLHIIAYMF